MCTHACKQEVYIIIHAHMQYHSCEFAHFFRSCNQLMCILARMQQVCMHTLEQHKCIHGSKGCVCTQTTRCVPESYRYRIARIYSKCVHTCKQQECAQANKWCTHASNRCASVQTTLDVIHMQSTGVCVCAMQVCMHVSNRCEGTHVGSRCVCV